MRGQAVKDAPAGKTIKITGTIQAASASGNYGELEITKNLTIEAKSGTATLDANSSVLGSNAHRIFNVTGGNFKLYNMVLQSGNAGENEGGGIYVSGGELVLSETTIKNCIAQDGGGIYLAGNGTTQQEFANIPAGGTVSFSTAADTDYAVYRWMGVTATPPDSATTTLTVTGDATVTVKFYQSEITGTVGSTRVWRSLLEAIKAEPEGATLKVSGTIRATNDGSGDTANYGEIVINKNLTIEGKTGAAADILDANENVLGAAKAHRIFHVESGKTLTLKNLTLKNGKKAGGNGGGIYSEGTLTLENTNIESSTASNGGAISNHGTLSITGGTFSKNTATADGGAIYSNSGTVTLSNATVGGTAANANKAKNGGGICLDGSAGMTLTNCQIINNEVTNGNGGGIHFKNGTAYGTSEYTITGGKISGNKVKMTDGVQTYSGGGLSIANIGIQLKLDGCEISSNTIEGDSMKQPRGAGIWLGNRTTCTIKGSAQIKDNTLHKTGDSNSFIGTGGGIQLDGGTLTFEGRTIISGNNAKNGGGLYVIGGAVTMTGGSIEYNKTIDGNGGGAYVSGDGASFTMTGGKITHCTADVSSASSMVGRGGGICIREGGKLYINIDASGNPDGASAQTVMANNHTDRTAIQAHASGGAIFCAQGIDLKLHNTKISDCGPIVTTADARAFGAGLALSGGGTATLTSVEISGCKFDKTGSGSYQAHSAGAIFIGLDPAAGITTTVTLGQSGGYPCNIHDNEGGETGGGIVNNGTLTINGGFITNNTAASGGGISGDNGSVTITGCTISGNEAESGGVRIKGGRLVMTSCTVKGNTGKNGGAIFAKKDGNSAPAVTISGGAIGGTDAADANKATGTGTDGGGIYIGEDCTLTMQDNAKIIGNAAAQSGGTEFLGRETMFRQHNAIRRRQTTFGR